MSAEPLVGDLAERSFAESLVERSLELFGRLDILVNNAGMPKHKQIFDVTPDEVQQTLSVNFLAPAALTLAALAPMLERGEGWIINISSVAGRIPSPRESVYCASKHALSGWTEGLALDLAGTNIHPAAVHVGPIDTEIWDKLESPQRFRGRKYPPSLVSAAVLRCIEKRLHAVTVPRHLALVFAMKLLAPRIFRWGAARWDPVGEENIRRARQEAAARLRD